MISIAQNQRRRGWDRRTERLALYLFVAILVLAPLPFGSNRPVAWTLLTTLTGLALMLWTLAAATAPERTVRVPIRVYRWYLLGMLALLAWFVVQASPLTPPDWHHPIWQEAAGALGASVKGSISAEPQRTSADAIRFATYCAVFFLAMQFGASARYTSLIFAALATSGVAYAVYGLAVDFGGFDSILWYPRWSYHDSLTSTFVNRNSFATYAGLILLAIATMLGRQFAQQDSLELRWGEQLNLLASRLWPLIVGFILVLMALLLSHSRGGLIAALVGLAALPAYRRIRWGRTAAAGVALSALFLVVLLIGAGETIRRIDEGGSRSAASRVTIYTATLDGIAERPLLGHGYGSFEAVFAHYRGTEMSNSPIVDKAHNSYLEFAFEAGLPAATIVIVMLAAIVWRCRSASATDRRLVSSARCGFAAGVLVGSHALVDFSAQIPAVAVIFATLLGLGVGSAHRAQSPAVAGSEQDLFVRD